MKETRALALLARIIGRRHGVEVEFSPFADTASTDGKKITLPVVSNLGTDDHAILIEGLLDHEAMHCRFTDFEVALGKLEPLVASLTNLIEDVWGEREQGKIYPGCARNIRRSMDVMIRLGWYRGPAAGAQEPPPTMMTNFLINGLLARLYQSQVLDGFARQYRKMLAGVLGEDLVRRIWETACKVDRVSSTSQALALAKEIVALLRQAMPPESPQPSAANAGQGSGGQSSSASSSGSGQSNPGDAGGSGQPGATSADGSQTGQSGSSPGNGSQPSAGSPGDGSNAQQPGGAGTSAGAGGGAGGPQGQAHGSAGSDDAQRKGDAIRQILGASADQLASGDMGDRLLAALNGQGKAGKSADDASHASLNGGRRQMSNAAGGPDAGYPLAAPQQAESDAFRYKLYNQAAIAMSRGIEVKLGTKLESLLEARTDSFVLHKRAGRRLDARRAPRLSLGKLDVFRTVEEGTEIDTSVQILIDCSASMLNNFAGTARVAGDIPLDETRIVAAAAVAYAAAQVLDKHDVPFAVACFGSRHLRLKSFDARWPVARKLALTDSLGGTATDCAVMRIADDLVLRQEARKLVVLVTDGEPHDEPASVAVMNEVRRLGIEFAVLFIGAQGYKFQRLLKADGYTVARALTRESLASSFFEAVESAF